MPDPAFRLVVLKTDQLDAVREFYGHLGFEFASEQHGSGPRHYWAPLGDGIIEVYPLPKDGIVDRTTRLGFAVDNLEKAIAAIGNPDAVVTGPRQTDWGLRAVVRDPDGRSVELYE